MEVAEKDGGIVFLRRLQEGPAAESYGIHVARLAGLSPAVLERAERIMERLRERENTITGEQLMAGNGGAEQKTETPAALPPGLAGMCRDLQSLDPERITPFEALSLLHEWKRIIAGGPNTIKKPRRQSDATPSLFD